jgi:NADPH:quinone reductase-like Zn-dependent oxidoreductase
VGITTVGQGLYQFLKLPLPTSPLSTPRPILINGGSTATGILGIQFAKLSGLAVLTTASPHNFDYLKSLGADEVFDYHTPAEELARQVKSRTDNKLTFAWDCSPTPESTRFCASAMSDSQPGIYGALLPVTDDTVKAINPQVTGGFTMGYTVFGEAFKRGGRDYPAKPQDREFGRAFWDLSRDLLAQGKFKVARIAVDQGGQGLEGVLKGLEDLRNRKVSGRKLVYTL